jgi:hypothetical protein
MIWQNPLAWAGLIALAVPVLIHLLGRRNARVQRFPTLRFLERSPLMSTRRTRLSDLSLLAVRLGIIGAAAAALAEPLFLTADRERDAGRALARAIIVDTGDSMQRAARSGEPGERALDLAQREAERRAAAAQTSVRLETIDPSAAVPGAVAWLATQPGRRELVVVSDFQVGAVDAPAIEAVPPEIGIALARVEIGSAADSPTAASLGASSPATIEIRSPANGAGVVARATLAPDRTDVEWPNAPRAAVQPGGLLVLAAANETSRAEAAREVALMAAGAPPIPTGRPVAIIYPRHEQRMRLARSAAPLDRPWQGDVALRVRRDSMLAAAAATAEVRGDSILRLSRPASTFTVLARTADGRPVAVAASGDLPRATAETVPDAAPASGAPRGLLVFSYADPASLAGAMLVAALARASTVTPPIAEHDPATISVDELAPWEREASAVVASDPGHAGASDGRWFWMLALALLALETWVRRSRPATAAPSAANERAA